MVVLCLYCCMCSCAQCLSRLSWADRVGIGYLRLQALAYPSEHRPQAALPSVVRLRRSVAVASGGRTKGLTLDFSTVVWLPLSVMAIEGNQTTYSPANYAGLSINKGVSLYIDLLTDLFHCPKNFHFIDHK